MSTSGLRESETIFTRRPILEADGWTSNAVIETAILDLVDFLPARHYPIFNPTTQQINFPTATLYPTLSSIFPEHRFVVHYFMHSNGTTRTTGAIPQAELSFLTGVGAIVPTLVARQIVRVPWVGTATRIENLPGGVTSEGVGQSGQFPITARYLKVVLRFSAASAVDFAAGVYLTPIHG